MLNVVVFLVSLGVRAIRAMCRRRADLVLENVALRQQVTALKKERPRPPLCAATHQEVAERWCDGGIVRFADDFTVGFQYREDAERFLEELRERFQRFHLELHPEKTRLMEFGRYAAENRKRRGEGKPESFDFLGFTHTCDKTRNGKFIVLRQTMRKRLQSKLREIKIELKRRLHHPVPEVGQWLRSVMQGHFNYYAVPRNQRKLGAFKYQVYRLWLRTLRQRSQRHRMTGERMNRLADRWFPPIRILYPYPEQRLRVMT